MAKAKPRKFLLQDCLVSGSRLRPLVISGMGAFKGSHKGLVAVNQRTRIGDSIDVDAASQPEFPNDNRWDYIVSVTDTRRLVAIEPHGAKDDEIPVVIRKKQHAMDYLRGHLATQFRVAQWFWVSVKGPTFSRMDKARRQLDQAGIKYVGRQLLTLD